MPYTTICNCHYSHPGCGRYRWEFAEHAALKRIIPYTPELCSACHGSMRRLYCTQENGGTQQTGLLTLNRLEFHNSTVERLPWQGAAFSQDSEHLVGATPGHKIYAWSLHTGKLEKFLEFEGEPCSPCMPRDSA